MEWVADHLGHSLQVERTYYRMASSVIQKAKIAKLLILADKGLVDSCKGKSLDDLNFDGKEVYIFMAPLLIDFIDRSIDCMIDCIID